MAHDLRQAFAEIGAELHLATGGRAFEIDVAQTGGRERFELRYPSTVSIVAEALDVKPAHRHLVLDVMAWDRPIDGRFLCGHDEHHWFVATVPFGSKTRSVRGAMESLKPLSVRREQKRRGVSHRRHRRRTAAYVRQGEWFFLPRPRMHVDAAFARQNGSLVRGRGKPHRVEWLYRDGDFTFVRGFVSHPDHDTLHLDVWHRVERNAEPEPVVTPRPQIRMAFLD